MKRSLLTLLIFLVLNDIALGQQQAVASNIWGDTIVQTSIVKVKSKNERVMEACKNFEIGASGGIVRPHVYDHNVWMPTPATPTFVDQFDYKTGGVFSARVAYHYWMLSLAATYTYLSELSYRYGPNVNKNIVYYFAKPMHLFGLAANFETKYGVYAGANSSYIYFDFGDRHSPRGITPSYLPYEPAPIVRAVTIGVQLGYTYTFYKGLGANAEVGMNTIPLKNTNAKAFFFPMTLGLRYRFEG